MRVRSAILTTAAFLAVLAGPAHSQRPDEARTVVVLAPRESSKDFPSDAMRSLVGSLDGRKIIDHLGQSERVAGLPVFNGTAEYFHVVYPLVSDAFSYTIVLDRESNDYWVIRHGGSAGVYEVYRGTSDGQAK